MNFKTILILSIIFSLFISCGKEGNVQNKEIATKTETPDQKSAQSIAVEALVIKSQTIEQNIPLTGVLKPLHSVDIVAEVSGKVKKIYKKLGDSITQRDTLAVIDDKVPLSNYRQAKSQVLSAENNLKIAELNLKSDEELFKSGDISQLAYENSQLAVKSAEANRLSALASLSLLEKNYKDTRIMSPISGLISRKFIELGTMVTPNMPLYRVVDLKVLKIEVGVSQIMISRLHIGSAAQVTISALKNRTFDGIVRFISPQADETTGAFMAEIHVQNTYDLKIKAGMTAKIDLTVTDLGKQLAVPDYALITKNGKDFVYKIENDIARLVEVSVAETFGSEAIITDGIAEGDTIVVVGMKNLGEDMKVWIETIH
ncbi:MAG: efflux RND transporter periplasmic adaptor subunit [bacterium]|nr:MAG: efflux RND transporter periplasmic adaptor subunit [bacterium]